MHLVGKILIGLLAIAAGIGFITGARLVNARGAWMNLLQVAKANDEHFDLLISDIGLPGRSGYDLMRELHNSKGLPGIALSGYGTEHDVNKARAAGFSEHLTKPINFDRLDEAIRTILGKS